MAQNNTHTKKQYAGMQGPAVKKAEQTKDVNAGNEGGKYKGQIDGQETFGQPLNANGIVAKIGGLGGTHNDIGELSGFITDGYLDKNGTPYGEGAKFNFLPPGMDISNQQNAEIHEMPMQLLTQLSYPGDGWMPKPRDIEE